MKIIINTRYEEKEIDVTELIDIDFILDNGQTFTVKPKSASLTITGPSQMTIEPRANNTISIR